MACTVLVSLVSYPSRATTPSTSTAYVVNGAMSKTVVDSAGGVSFLWVARPLNSQDQTSGIWYSRFALNGTNLISPVQIRNSTEVQSADMVVDQLNVPHIVWAEGTAFSNSSTIPIRGDAALYSMTVNLTNPRSSRAFEIDGRDGVVMWPTLALDNASRIHIVWSAASKGEIHLYYGLLGEHEIQPDPIVLATYNQSAAVSRIQMTYDGSSALHVVWVDTENSSGILTSKVNYAYVNPFQNNITRLQIAHVDGELKNAAVMNAPNEGAYVLWQPQFTSSDDLLYVSHVSRNGSMVFSREIPAPANSNAWHLEITSDSQENLYLVWYPQPVLSIPSPNAHSISSNVNYIKILGDGSIAESGNDIVLGQVLAVNVGGSGNLYAISTQGMVQVPLQVTPFTGIGYGLLGVILALTVAIGGVVVTDEGKYQVARSLRKLPRKPASGAEDESTTQRALLTMIARSPGVTYSHLQTVSKEHGGSMRDIVALEEEGHLASVRVGLHRGFYRVAPAHTSPPIPDEQNNDPIATRILRAVAANPDTWEAQLARDLALSQQIVHYHLKRLVNRKMMTTTVKGRRILYRAIYDTKAR